VDKAKIEVIEQLPPPTNVKGVHSFLGHAGFIEDLYKTFLRLLDSSLIFWPKNAPFVFTEKCLQSFHTLKKALIFAPIIQPSD
jgi:hypothetical protein